MEGSNQTLRDSIRDIVGAIGPRTTVHRIVQNPSLSSTGKQGNGRDDDAAIVELVDESTDLDEEQRDAVEEQSRSRAPRNRTFRSPEVVDIDLVAGDVPLKEFLQRANPETDAKRYLLIAHWMKVHRGLKEISDDHVYTGYRSMGWTTIPADASGPLRQLKKDGYFKKGEGPRCYAINHLGEQKAIELTAQPQSPT